MTIRGSEGFGKLVPPQGFEPWVLRLQGGRSDLLSYDGISGADTGNRTLIASLEGWRATGATRKAPFSPPAGIPAMGSHSSWLEYCPESSPRSGIW